jgi:hypothetical protein
MSDGVTSINFGGSTTTGTSTTKGKSELGKDDF